MFMKFRTRWNSILSALAGVSMLFTGALAGAAESKAAKPAPPDDADLYTLDKCVVTGQKLGSMGDPVIYNHKGREIRFCCKGCVAKFEAKPANYLKGIDAALIKQQLPDYPIETCVVTGEKFGGMGDPVNYIHKNRLVRFCCAGCAAQFQKAPAKYIAALDKAVVAKQKASYPLDTCVVSGEKFGAMGEPIDYVVANRLVRFCCAGCVKTFEKDPLKYLAKLDEAAKAKSGGAPKPAATQPAAAQDHSTHQH